MKLIRYMRIVYIYICIYIICQCTLESIEFYSSNLVLFVLLFMKIHFMFLGEGRGGACSRTQHTLLAKVPFIANSTSRAIKLETKVQ